MLARNSIGRSVSLLNEDYSNSKAEGRSPSLSSLPSISSFYTALPLSSPKNSRHHSELSKQQQFSSNCSVKNSSKHTNSSSLANVSPNNSSGDCSPTLSNCSTEVDSTTSNTQYSPEYYVANSHKTAAGFTKSLPIHTAGSQQQQYQSQHSNQQQQQQQQLPQRPAGPAPLLVTNNSSSSRFNNSNNSHNCSVSSSSSSSANNGYEPSSNNSSSYSSLLSNQQQQLNNKNSSSFSCSSNTTSTTKTTTSSSTTNSFSSLPSLFNHNKNTHSPQSSYSRSSSTSSSNTSHTGSNNHILLDSFNRPGLSCSNSNNSSRSSSSILTPLTPPTPASIHNGSSPSSHHNSSKMMDPHSKSMVYPTMLSSPTADTFLYGGPASINTGMNQRNSITGQYFSVAQQPLPPPVTSTSPIMYSTLDSPNTLGMMDPYLPIQQQQSMAAIPFQPYPTELLPSSMHMPQPSTNQSIVATSPSDTSNNSAPKTAKKKYPCPHAAKYNCSDTFTTSGHAARHGKKHTGEKNIHCPVCDKAFTRKDNMKQHERTHRNKGEASKVAEAVESSKRTAHHQSSLSKTSTNSSTEVEMEDAAPAPPKRSSDPQASIRAANQQRRPNLSSVQQLVAPSLTSPTAADIPMPVTLDSNETLQPVAPSLKVEPLDKSFTNIFDHSFNSRSQETLLGRPAIFERTTSTGSGFSADGEGESPGLDALAMAAELS